MLGLSAKPFEAATAEELEKAEIAGVVKIPPRLANAFANGLTLESDDIAGRFSVRKAGENFAISTTAPLSLTRATFKKGGEILASNLNLFANAAIVAGKTSSAKIELELADSKTSKLVLDIDAKYSGGAASGTLGLDGSLNPIVKNVPSMSAVSSLDLSAKADAAFEYAKTSAKLKSFALSISTADGKKAADISTLSAIEYDTASGNISATSPKLLLVDAPEFPFALVRPFAPEIDAAKAAARIEISSPKKNVYEMDSAFSVYALSYKKDGKYLIRGLSIDAAPKGSFDGATAKVEIPEGTIGEGSAKFCTFKASAAYDTKGKAAPSAKISATTALAPIFNQPALLKFSNISRGTADISAVYENGKANADIAVHSLATRTANNVLETVKISAITDMESVEAKAEIKTTAGFGKRQKFRRARRKARRAVDSCGRRSRACGRVLQPQLHRGNREDIGGRKRQKTPDCQADARRAFRIENIRGGLNRQERHKGVLVLRQRRFGCSRHGQGRFERNGSARKILGARKCDSIGTVSDKILGAVPRREL